MKGFKKMIGSVLVLSIGLGGIFQGVGTAKAAELTDQERVQLMERFAPKVYLHKDEQYFPGDVNEWLSSVEMRYLTKDTRIKAFGAVIGGSIEYDRWEGVTVTPSNITNFTSSTGVRSDEVVGEDEEANFYLQRMVDDAKYGDNDGVVDPPVYARYYVGTEYDTITYGFWYPHNGNIGPDVPDAASHEGDWEGIEVYVDKTTKEIHSIGVNAHGEEYEYYGADEFEYEGTHPKVYSAIDSHATYILKAATSTDTGTWKIDRPAARDPLCPDDHITNNGKTWDTWNNVEVLANQNWLNYRGRWGKIAIDMKDGPTGPQIDNEASIERFENMLIFYSRDNCIGNMRAPLKITGDLTYNLTNDPAEGISKIANDEIRSFKLNRVSAGTLIKMYDDPNGGTSDDYVEIYVKKDIDTTVYVNAINRYMETDEVIVWPHVNNGLLGKVSRVEIDVDSSFTPPTSLMSMWEGNNATQDLVGTINLSGNVEVNLQNYISENDEMRSLTIHNPRANTAITFYDSPNGDTTDDFTTIYIKQSSSEDLVIGSLENYISNDKVTVVPHPNNGLDGKVSRIKVETNLPSVEDKTTAIFHRGDNVTGGVVGAIEFARNAAQNFNFHYSSVINDEARSLVIKNGKAGTFFRLADDPNGGLHDDYTDFYIKKDFDEYRVNTFSRFISNEYISVFPQYINGLNGKVSSLYTNTTSSAPSAPAGSVEFYEGNGVSQDLLGTWGVGTNVIDVNLQQHMMENDEARSMRLRNLPPGTVIGVFDDPSAARYWADDYSVTVVKRYLSTIDIASFENNWNDANTTIKKYHKNGLDGKVSRIVIVPNFAGEYIKIRNRWLNSYLTQSGDQLIYTTTPSGDYSYWELVRLEAGNEVMIRNKATGDYINIENFAGTNESHIQVTDVPTGYNSAKWVLDYDDVYNFRINTYWARIKGERNVNNLGINTEDNDGKVQATDIGGGYHSTQWRIER